MVDRGCPVDCVLFSWGAGEISHQITKRPFRIVVMVCLGERFSTGHVDINWEEISLVRIGQRGALVAFVISPFRLGLLD